MADPLGGSWFVESLTDEIERQAEAVFARLDEWGEGSILDGVLHGIETNWFQGEIADAAYLFQRKVASGRRVVVGVNAFTEGNEEPAPPTLQIGPEVDEAQRKRLACGPPTPVPDRRRQGPGRGSRRRGRGGPQPHARHPRRSGRLRHRRARSWERWRRCSGAGPRIPSSDRDPPRSLAGLSHPVILIGWTSSSSIAAARCTAPYAPEGPRTRR